MSFFNFGKTKKTLVTVVQNENSSSTSSTSSGITKTSYQYKSSVSSSGHVDGVSFNRSISSPVSTKSSSALPSTKKIEQASGEKSQGCLQIDEKFINACLEKHNYYRDIHGVPPLKINDKLCKFSQEWATKLAKMGKMEHRKNSEYGENLYFKWSSNPKCLVTGDEAVVSWYSEIKDYKYGTDRSASTTGHFTQVVWKDSTELGVGFSRNSKGEIYVVCNYNPPGNFIGSFGNNVLKPCK
ncbi:hypothetical protein HCN44_000034 [Aphidius gifuensis]|uniref:SCP domain-containing protein n=1 Tax=Aphidius gifuensis TaxID=684658 RepID=A0A835CP53_APHGI|nr:Golgi-associated plant pathogenesis-related protein 1 [Aphidius gifuensis]KAF7990229.1 hypothetical protein HCN44_000034 [Aphidius gifuensis]